MRAPFPELKKLQLASHDETLSSHSRSRFILLRYFGLSDIPSQDYQNCYGLLLTLSTFRSLVSKSLTPDPFYLMAVLLAALSSPETLCLGFRTPQSRPDWESRSSPLLLNSRSILPALDELNFKGVTDYSEEFVAGVDPSIRQNFCRVEGCLIEESYMHGMHITFLNQIDSDCQRLAH
jgi:hypothetical protein